MSDENTHSWNWRFCIFLLDLVWHVTVRLPIRLAVLGLLRIGIAPGHISRFAARLGKDT